jgi:two-component system OmpR family response regulator
MLQPPTSILVVDDDRAIAQLLNDVLTDEGYTVRTCFTGIAAWELLQEHKPALMITDLRMETDEAGFVLVQRMRAVPRLESTPVILCAANHQFLTTHCDELHQLNCETLEKPFDLGNLLATVDSLVPCPLLQSADSR